MDSGGTGRTGAGYHDESCAESRFTGPKKSRFPLKLVSGALLFCALTLSVFYYQFSRIEQGNTVFSWHLLHFEYLWLLLVCLPFDSCASALRIWLVCRVLKRKAGYWMCLKAEWANVGMAMLTPTQTGGGFGQIYILSRNGINISAATVISLITFLGTMMALLFIGLCAALFSGASAGSFVSLVVWPMTLVFGLMTIPLLWPGLFRLALSKALAALSVAYCFCYRMLFRTMYVSDGRLSGMERLGAKVTDLAYQYHCDTWKFIREGRLHFVCICLLSLVFFMARCLMAFFCLRLLGVDASSMGEILKIQMVLLFVLYLAPTPGASGIAELLSLSAMSAIIPSEFGAYYNLLWRASTLYVPALLGLLVLSVALLNDTGRLFRRKTALMTGAQGTQTPPIATLSNPSARTRNSQLNRLDSTASRPRKGAGVEHLDRRPVT